MLFGTAQVTSNPITTVGGSRAAANRSTSARESSHRPDPGSLTATSRSPPVLAAGSVSAAPPGADGPPAGPSDRLPVPRAAVRCASRRR